MGDRDALVGAHRTGGLLQAIREAISPDPAERKSLASDLAALHNEGAIDLIAAFSGLPGAAESGPEFFLLRHVFEDVLPEVEAPVGQIAECVQRLYREAGTDMAAGTILDAFRDFCAKRPERVPAALAAIEAARKIFPIWSSRYSLPARRSILQPMLTRPFASLGTRALSCAGGPYLPSAASTLPGPLVGARRPSR